MCTHQGQEIPSVEESHLPQEVHDDAEVSREDQGQSHCRGEHQGWSRCEATHVNHGQQLGLEAKPGVRQSPRGASAP